mmetsp:Transcript_10797/g.23126  ORF Transcript_10797/g.23126 Transcript_10797/m.23126 type:complete len:242 (+) Transcript_10797:372-1097(+)
MQGDARLRHAHPASHAIRIRRRILQVEAARHPRLRRHVPRHEQGLRVPAVRDLPPLRRRLPSGAPPGRQGAVRPHQALPAARDARGRHPRRGGVGGVPFGAGRLRPRQPRRTPAAGVGHRAGQRPPPLQDHRRPPDLKAHPGDVRVRGGGPAAVGVRAAGQGPRAGAGAQGEEPPPSPCRRAAGGAQRGVPGVHPGAGGLGLGPLRLPRPHRGPPLQGAGAERAGRVRSGAGGGGVRVRLH